MFLLIPCLALLLVVVKKVSAAVVTSGLVIFLLFMIVALTHTLLVFLILTWVISYLATAVAIWLFLDSRRKKGNPWLWGVAGLAFSINAANPWLKQRRK